jgi:hypothetical protein
MCHENKLVKFVGERPLAGCDDLACEFAEKCNRGFLGVGGLPPYGAAEGGVQGGRRRERERL